MKYKISPDRRTLTITADKLERKRLRDGFPQSIGTDTRLYAEFEHLIANSELEWVHGQTSGDLTDAPMLGIMGDEMRAAVIKENGISHFGTRQSGADRNGAWFQPILERWAFMDYQVRSVLEDLRDTGKAVFTS